MTNLPREYNPDEPPEPTWVSIGPIDDLRCRFGCNEPIGIFYLPRGCACWSDQLQALCLQHFVKAEPIAGMRCLINFHLSYVE